MGATPAAYAFAAARCRNGRGFNHAFPAEARRPDAIRALSARGERDAGLYLRRSCEDSAAAFRRMEEDLRSDLAGRRGERAQSAARPALVQSALRAEDDRGGSTPRCFRQAA